MPDKLYGTDKISKKDSQAMLRRAKEILASRSIDTMPQEQREHLDQRYRGIRNNVPHKLFSIIFLRLSVRIRLYFRSRIASIMLIWLYPRMGTARVSDIARSHSIWLDPVDASQRTLQISYAL